MWLGLLGNLNLIRDEISHILFLTYLGRISMVYPIAVNLGALCLSLQKEIRCSAVGVFR